MRGVAVAAVARHSGALPLPRRASRVPPDDENAEPVLRDLDGGERVGGASERARSRERTRDGERSTNIERARKKKGSRSLVSVFFTHHLDACWNSKKTSLPNPRLCTLSSGSVMDHSMSQFSSVGMPATVNVVLKYGSTSSAPERARASGQVAERAVERSSAGERVTARQPGVGE
jgi:hypothetical protein